jgi:hypothetical protein
MRYSCIVFLLGTVTTFGQDLQTSQEKNKNAIEYRLITEPNKVIFLVKLKGEEDLKKITDGNWPDNIELIYNILKNNDGQIVYLGEFPTSESGDWTLQLEHYFDDNGKLVAFQKHLTYFNEDCTQGVIIEDILELFDNDFRIIKTKNTLTDGKGKPLAGEECGHGYNWSTVRKPTVDELIKLKDIRE